MYSTDWLGGRYVPDINDLVILKFISIKIPSVSSGSLYLANKLLNILPNIDHNLLLNRFLWNLKALEFLQS